MIRISEIAEGNAGIYETAEKMRALARSPSPRVERLAQSLRLEYPRASRYVLAAAVHTWIVTTMRYVSDDPEIEELSSPELLMAQVENRGEALGDCDDFSILTAALLLTLGIPATFVLASTRQDRTFDHVYVEALTEQGAVAMDGIFKQPFGWSARTSFTAVERVSV